MARHRLGVPGRAHRRRGTFDDTQESNSGDHAAQPKTSREQGGWLFTKSVIPHRVRAREAESSRLSRLSQVGSVTDVTDSLCMSIGRRCLS